MSLTFKQINGYPPSLSMVHMNVRVAVGNQVHYMGGLNWVDGVKLKTGDIVMKTSGTEAAGLWVAQAGRAWIRLETPPAGSIIKVLYGSTFADTYWLVQEVPVRVSPTKRKRTAVVTVEVTNEDGSKEILKSVPLDASMIDRNAKKFSVEAVDPYTADDDYGFGIYRRGGYITSPAPKDFFSIDLQLPIIDRSGPVYSVQKIDPPELNNQVIMVWSPTFPDDKPEIYIWTMEKAAEAADHWPNLIYFVLESI